MRRPIIAGNWKMNLLMGESKELAHSITREFDKLDGFEEKNGDVVICPPFTSLYEVSKCIAGSNVWLGAQNMYWEENGAYTGEISPQFLLDIGCKFVIIGHSERRQHFGETDFGVNRKAKVAVTKGLTPIICVGESVQEREEKKTEEIVEREIKAAFEGFTRDEALLTVIAYEPIWAIGTGNTATPADARSVHKFVREVLAQIYNEEVSQAIRIQYGGSVAPDNIEGLMNESDIDGALVGGASLKAKSFIELVKKGLKLSSSLQLQ
jgi:triosephosphate isomerase